MRRSPSVALAAWSAFGTKVPSPREAVDWLERTTCTIPALTRLSQTLLASTFAARSGELNVGDPKRDHGYEAQPLHPCCSNCTL